MFQKDFKEFIRLLQDNRIDYLVVGGYAVGIHGYPRYTGDIDVWIRLSDDLPDALHIVLNNFGFRIEPKELREVISSNQMIRMGVPPYRIDILFSIEGVNFDDCYPRKIEKQIGEMIINFISFEDLIRNKKATGRDQDMLDIKKLTRKK